MGDAGHTGEKPFHVGDRIANPGRGSRTLAERALVVMFSRDQGRAIPQISTEE